MEIPKKAYLTPELTVCGDLDRITQGSSDGSALDATFQVGTPRGQLTFS